MTPTLDTPARAAMPDRWRWPRAALLLLVGAAGLVALRDRLPDPVEVARILVAADWRWTAGAVVAALWSQVAFAVQQRRLLRGFGVGVPLPRMVAVTFSRSAMSMALPAGSALSAAYAFRFYRSHGAGGTVAAVVTAVSGIISAAALGLLYGTGWLAANPGAIPVVLGGALAVPLLVILKRVNRKWRMRRDRTAGPAWRAGDVWRAGRVWAADRARHGRGSSRIGHGRCADRGRRGCGLSRIGHGRCGDRGRRGCGLLRIGWGRGADGDRWGRRSCRIRLGRGVHPDRRVCGERIGGRDRGEPGGVRDDRWRWISRRRELMAGRWPAVEVALRGLRDLRWRSWAGALRAAVVNWLLDFVCLAAAAMACQATVGWARLAVIYLAVQIVRQVPLTPGGVGLIEASMLAGLTAAGMAEATALAVVLLYRLISCWMILPLGVAGWLFLRRGGERRGSRGGVENGAGADGRKVRDGGHGGGADGKAGGGGGKAGGGGGKAGGGGGKAGGCGGTDAGGESVGGEAHRDDLWSVSSTGSAHGVRAG